ncbi:MAG: CBS domain-containing protein [Acidobacteria bacterium]|nr:CBS domain-containing protein [Acidobacteriota bacterium]
MSRYGDERDDYHYGGRRGDGRRGYYGGRGAEPLDAAYDERTRVRPRDFDAREDRGGYRDRDYRDDYETGAVGRRGERDDYERYGRGFGDEYRERRPARDDHAEGRSPWEGARNYFARRERERGRTARSHIRCRDIMTRDVTVATRESTLEEVARMMRDEDTGVIPVVERAPSLTDLGETSRPDVNRVEPNVVGGNRLVGLITDRDVVVRAIAEGKDPRETRAGEIMTTDIHTAQPNDRVIEAVRKMGDKQVRRIPVVDTQGNLRGIISMADIALETDDDRELAEALEEISSGQSFWNRIFG